MATTEEIDSIVHEVLRRLAQLTAASENSQGGREQENLQELHLHDRVITLALLNGRLDHLQRLVVPTNAILTPAVQDALRERKIEWQRATVDKRQSPQRLALLLATDDANVCLREWKQLVNSCETFAERQARAIVSRVSEWVAVDAAHVAVVFSQRPQWLACRLNKVEQIRAAVAFAAAHVTQAIDEAGANALVIDSRTDQHAKAAWRSWVDQFRSGRERREPLTERF